MRTTPLRGRSWATAAAYAADILLKVRRPDSDDVAAMQPGGIYLGLVESCGEDATLSAMLAKGMRVLGMERIPRISRAQSMDALSSQSNIAGYRAVIEAAARYGRFFPMMMTSAGSAKPARLVVLGAGVAGLQAIATARRLGAEVWAYDVRPETREQIQSLGAKPIDLDIGESGAGEGGYAKELSAEAKARQQAALADELAKAHVIITTALIPCRPAPVLITEEVVKRMRPGSVIVDLAAANGGNCPLTVPDEVVERHGVTLVGHTNYPSMVAADASAFYAKNLANLLDIMIDTSDSMRARCSRTWTRTRSPRPCRCAPDRSSPLPLAEYPHHDRNHGALCLRPGLLYRLLRHLGRDPGPAYAPGGPDQRHLRDRHRRRPAGDRAGGRWYRRRADRLPGRAARLHQRLRRLSGDAPDAVHVQ